MSLQSFLFVAIDKLYNPFQNERKMTKFKDVDFEIKTDIVYDTSAPEACKLDTYRVKGLKGKLPVLFYIHGGGFVAGDKHYRRALARWSANLGYFVVNVNYGLCPEYQCPVPHRQLVAALNWVGANAEKLGLDLDRMIVSGDSAGGYYGAMLAAITLNPDLQAKMGVSTSLKFGGAVLNCGIYDVATALKNKYPFDLGGKLLKDFAGIGKDEIEGYEWKDLCSVLPFVNEQFPALLHHPRAEGHLLRRSGGRAHEAPEGEGRALRRVPFHEPHRQPLLLPQLEEQGGEEEQRSHRGLHETLRGGKDLTKKSRRERKAPSFFIARRARTGYNGRRDRGIVKTF